MTGAITARELAAAGARVSVFDLGGAPGVDSVSKRMLQCMPWCVI